MNKADMIRLNQRWISETEEKIKGLDAEIVVFEIDIRAYRKAIARLEGEDERMLEDMHREDKKAE